MYTVFGIIKNSEWIGSRVKAESAIAFADSAFEADRSAEYWVIPYAATTEPDTDAMSMDVIYAIGS